MIKDLGWTSYADDLWDFDLKPVKPINITGFYGLMDRKRSIKKEFIIRNYGQQYCVYSPFSNRYYLRELHSQNELRPLIRYINDKNLYLLLTPEQEEEQAKLLKRLSLHSFEQYQELVALNLRLEACHETEQGKKGYITRVHQLELQIKNLKE